VFEAVAAEARTKLTKFRSHDLADTAWAFATAGVDAPELFQATAVLARMRVADFAARDLCRTVWAFAIAGVEAPQLFEAAAAQASNDAAAFTSCELVDLVWAYSAAGVAAPGLFEAVAAKALEKISSFDSHDLARLTRSYASVTAPALFEAVAEDALEKLAAFNSKNLADTAYSAAGVSAPALSEASRTDASASPDGLAQLHQVLVHLQTETPHHPLTERLSRYEAELRAAYLREAPTPAESRENVSVALKRIGWGHEVDHVTAEGLSVDMAQPTAKVAVLFGRPTRYLEGNGASTRDAASTTEVDDGAEAAALRGAGWTVIRVPYDEWDCRSQAQREAYLRRKTSSRGAVSEGDS